MQKRKIKISSATIFDLQTKKVHETIKFEPIIVDSPREYPEVIEKLKKDICSAGAKSYNFGINLMPVFV